MKKTADCDHARFILVAKPRRNEMRASEGDFAGHVHSSRAGQCGAAPTVSIGVIGFSSVDWTGIVPTKVMA
jgi:hypothetical protein